MIKAFKSMSKDRLLSRLSESKWVKSEINFDNERLKKDQRRIY